MWEWIDKTLTQFRGCFSRQASFRWFVIAVLGLALRTGALGVTDIIRELAINPRHYESLLCFFRAASWDVASIRHKWAAAVKQSGSLFLEGQKPVLLGDGVAQSKEGRRMPSVRRLFQESGNASKPRYTFGHFFGAVGVLAGTAEKLFCVPLSMTVHAGARVLSKWMETSDSTFPDDFHRSSAEGESHAVRIVREASHIAGVLAPSILLLDRHFLSVPALAACAEEAGRAGRRMLSIVTKAKSKASAVGASYAVAYEKPTRNPGRGRPKKKGDAVRLKELFCSQASRFMQAKVFMYGEMRDVRYLSLDLLWGKGLYQELRFVLVEYGDTQSILASNDVALSPEQIIRLYSYRFKIENCFREMKQVVSGFAYRFWSKSMPKLKRYAAAGSSDEALSAVSGEGAQKSIASTFTAIEGFVMFSCIAMGLVQLCSLRFAGIVSHSPFRWLRTVSSRIPSEATTVDFMRKSFFRVFHKRLDLPIMSLIRSAQCDYGENAESFHV